MATTREEIRSWYERGVKEKQAYMIVVCDTFDWEDYPVYAKADEFQAKFKDHNGTNMQKVMEVYDLNGDKDLQLAQRRAWSVPK